MRSHCKGAQGSIVVIERRHPAVMRMPTTRCAKSTVDRGPVGREWGARRRWRRGAADCIGRRDHITRERCGDWGSWCWARCRASTLSSHCPLAKAPRRQRGRRLEWDARWVGRGRAL